MAEGNIRRGYLCGPVSGLPDGNRAAFEEAERELTEEGWLVYNPLNHPRSAECLEESQRLGDGYASGPVYCTLMRDFIRWICDADAVFVLPGWHAATGANSEVFVAARIGVPVIDLQKCRPMTVRFQPLVPQVALHGTEDARWPHPRDEETGRFTHGR